MGRGRWEKVKEFGQWLVSNTQRHPPHPPPPKGFRPNGPVPLLPQGWHTPEGQRALSRTTNGGME